MCVYFFSCFFFPFFFFVHRRTLLVFQVRSDLDQVANQMKIFHEIMSSCAGPQEVLEVSLFSFFMFIFFGVHAAVSFFFLYDGDLLYSP